MSSAFKNLELGLILMWNDRLNSKQVGSQASRRVTRWLAWIQPVCISINAVPALKGLTYIIQKIDRAFWHTYITQTTTTQDIKCSTHLDSGPGVVDLVIVIEPLGRGFGHAGEWDLYPYVLAGTHSNVLDTRHVQDRLAWNTVKSVKMLS